MVDVQKLRKGVKIRVESGEVLTVRGCYMSPDGVVVTAHVDGSICDRNIPFDKVKEVVE